MATSMMTTLPQFTGLRPQLKPSPIQGLVINHSFHVIILLFIVNVTYVLLYILTSLVHTNYKNACF